MDAKKWLDDDVVEKAVREEAARLEASIIAGCCGCGCQLVKDGQVITEALLVQIEDGHKYPLCRSCYNALAVVANVR